MDSYVSIWPVIGPCKIFVRNVARTETPPSVAFQQYTDNGRGEGQNNTRTFNIQYSLKPFKHRQKTNCTKGTSITLTYMQHTDMYKHKKGGLLKVHVN